MLEGGLHSFKGTWVHFLEIILCHGKVVFGDTRPVDIEIPWFPVWYPFVGRFY